MKGLLGLFVLSLLWTTYSHAQTSVERFQPSVLSHGQITNLSAQALGDSQHAFQMIGHLSDASMIFEDAGERTDIIGQRLLIDLGWAYGLTSTLDLAVDLPVILLQDGLKLSEDSELASTTLGDARLVARQQLWTQKTQRPWQLAGFVAMALPTGSPADYSGQDGLSGSLGVVTEGELGARLRLNAYFGYALKPDAELAGLDIGDEMITGLGIAFQWSDDSPVLQSEFKAWLPAADFGTEESTAGDVNLGLNWPLSDEHAAGLGVGFGVLPGVGSPGWRGFLGYTYHPRVSGSERSPEATPRTAAILNTAFVRSATPDDLDGDGLFNEQDHCPTLPEDKDNFLDQDGCPDTDNDYDGVRDDEDAAANIPEDWDGFEDSDGVLDADNDQDGIADGDDRCPNESGAGDGCPGSPMDWVDQIDRLGGIAHPIQLGQFIYPPNPISFHDGKPQLTKDGDAQVTVLGQFIQKRPHLLRLEIASHVHTPEGPIYDQWLSAQRALAVKKALMAAGIDSARLFPRAYGRSLQRAVPKFARNSNTSIELRVLEPQEEDPIFQTPERPADTQSIEEVDTEDRIRPKIIRLGTTLRPERPIAFVGRSADLTEDDQKTLNRLAVQMLAQDAIRMEIGVHTSGLGNASRQLKLSEARAAELKKVFMEKGVPGDILTSRGYGGTKPLESPKTIEGRRKNRRVEIRVMVASSDKKESQEKAEDAR